MTSEEARGFVEFHREHIDRVCAAMARRNGFTPDRTVLFAAWIDHALADNDYEAIRGMRTEDVRPTTFLTVVIAMLSRRFLRPTSPALGDRFA